MVSILQHISEIDLDFCL